MGWQSDCVCSYAGHGGGAADEQIFVHFIAAPLRSGREQGMLDGDIGSASYSNYGGDGGAPAI